MAGVVEEDLGDGQPGRLQQALLRRHYLILATGLAVAGVHLQHPLHGPR